MLNSLVALWSMLPSIIFASYVAVVLCDVLSLLACSDIGSESYRNESVIDVVICHGFLLFFQAAVPVPRYKYCFRFDSSLPEMARATGFMCSATCSRIVLDPIPVFNHDLRTAFIYCSHICLEVVFGCSFCGGCSSVETVHICFVKLLFPLSFHDFVPELLISVSFRFNTSAAFGMFMFLLDCYLFFLFLLVSISHTSGIVFVPMDLFWIFMNLTFLLLHRCW